MALTTEQQAGQLIINAASWAAKAVRDAAAKPPPAPPPSNPLVDIMPTTVNGAENIAILKKYPSVGGPQRIQRLVFPVNPETYTLTHHRDSQDVSLLTQGTLSRPGARVPREANFDSFFPDPDRTPDGVNWTNLANADLPDPWTSVKNIRDWQNSANQADGEAPLLLVVQDTAEAFSMWCMITQFDVNTKPREVGDVYFTIAFKEISSFPTILKAKTRKPKPSTAATVAAAVRSASGAVSGGAAQVVNRVDPRPAPTTITTVFGDNLSLVSARAYKGVSDGEHMTALYNANKSKLPLNKLDVLNPGIRLIVPVI